MPQGEFQKKMIDFFKTLLIFLLIFLVFHTFLHRYSEKNKLQNFPKPKEYVFYGSQEVKTNLTNFEDFVQNDILQKIPEDIRENVSKNLKRKRFEKRLMFYYNFVDFRLKNL